MTSESASIKIITKKWQQARYGSTVNCKKEIIKLLCFVNHMVPIIAVKLSHSGSGLEGTNNEN